MDLSSYVENNLSREDKLIVRMGLLGRDYNELKNIVDSYRDNKGVLRKTLEYLGIIEEHLEIRVYQRAVEVCEDVHDLMGQEGLVRRISGRV